MPPCRLALAISLAAVLVAQAACTSQPAERSPTPRNPTPPNIVIFITDDQRADTVTEDAMPSTVRWFRERGVWYPNAYAATPLCCPSRASIMTGRYAHNHEARGNGGESSRALDQRTTLHYHLRQAGYRVGIFGKFLNAWHLEQDPPFFHEWSIFNKHYYDSVFNDGGEVKTIAAYSTDFIGTRSLQFLEASEEEDERPWLLYVAPFAPHNRPVPEEKYRDTPVDAFARNPATGEIDVGDKPAYIREARTPIAQVASRSAQQLRTLMSVDDMVQRIMSRLDANGERRNTLAFFTSDNGVLWGEHNWQSKSVPYDASIGVPLYARWPAGGLSGGLTDRRLVANVDIAATILDTVGVDPEEPLDGRSLLDDWTRKRVLTEYWRTFPDATVPDWASIVTKRVQYIEYYAEDGGTITFREYYRLKDDPWQLRNVLHDGNTGNDPPEQLLAKVAAQLRNARTCAGTTGPTPCP